jgi:NAD(P)-dependent dehydrogenase (short-subunit alcohol dehydrogenase family)
MPGMLKRNWGRILFISSECAYLVPPDMISYSATKAALHAVARGLSQLTKSTAVTVNTVVPGSTLTEGAQVFLANKAKTENKLIDEVEQSFFEGERSNSLLQRFARVEEVASTVAYLCSPLSSATNGSVVKVDGGSSGGIL